MTRNTLKRFFTVTRQYFSRFQPSSANSGSPLKIARPNASGVPSNENLPSPIRRRRLDPMKGLGFMARELATLLKFVSGRR